MPSSLLALKLLCGTNQAVILVSASPPIKMLGLLVGRRPESP